MFLLQMDHYYYKFQMQERERGGRGRTEERTEERSSSEPSCGYGTKRGQLAQGYTKANIDGLTNELWPWAWTQIWSHWKGWVNWAIVSFATLPQPQMKWLAFLVATLVKAKVCSTFSHSYTPSLLLLPPLPLTISLPFHQTCFQPLCLPHPLAKPKPPNE